MLDYGNFGCKLATRGASFVGTWRDTGFSWRFIAKRRTDVNAHHQLSGSRNHRSGQAGRKTMNQTELWSLWKDATRLDRTVRITETQLPELQRKQVRSEPYSRTGAFHRMACREVAVFRNMPVLLQKRGKDETVETLVRTFSTKFPRNQTSRVQVGPSGRETRLPIREIMRRWSGRRAIVGVTDLHIRDTRVEEVIDTSCLSDFNILISGSDDLASEEMMTLVIASAGNVTDSHSDDPDGTNHCFIGKKLWMAWDTFEGLAAGLQDVERLDVYGVARFDMNRFLSLKSSRWFVVSTGQTLFLPGSLTHKVLTLEPYLGVGSFHVGLPSALDSFTRWIAHGPLWSLNDRKGENAGLVDESIRLALRIAKRCQTASVLTQGKWGFGYLGQAYCVWRKTISESTKQKVMQHQTFLQFLDIAESSTEADAA